MEAVLRPDHVRYLTKELKWLSSSLSQGRDIDVQRDIFLES